MTLFCSLLSRFRIPCLRQAVLIISKELNMSSSRRALKSSDIVYLIALIFVSLFIAGTSLAANNDTTAIVIVGTVHSETSNFKVETLCRIIDRVKPDLILVELDSSFMTPSMNIKPELSNVSLENRAIRDCAQARAIPLRPYDIEGRNKIYEQHNYFNLQRELSRALDQALKDSLLGDSARILLDAIIRFDDIGHTFGSERAEIINSEACDIAMESKQYYAGTGMMQIVASVPSLRHFADFCAFRRDFWMSRNEEMAKNIVHWTNLLRPKTVLVLCGFEHRYYLRSALNKLRVNNAFNLREYWTY
jgi:hypothetical protein